MVRDSPPVVRRDGRPSAPLNQFLDWIGASRIAFFGDSTWAIPTIAFVNVWRNMGYTALLIFAGIQTIPKYVYEAACSR